MIEKRRNCQAVCSGNGEVFVFGGCDDNWSMISCVEKYSPFTNTWKKVGEMEEYRINFCACSFMDDILIFGGCHRKHKSYSTNSCLKFDTSDSSWKSVASMNESRSFAACAVFEGSIVVCGGYTDNVCLCTVESYDVIADEWSSMPDMINRAKEHSLVVVRNKLFVIGYKLFEVFDNTCKKFLSIKVPYKNLLGKSISIGNKILIIQAYTPYIIFYDVDKDEWYEKSCEPSFMDFNCVKVPWYKANL